MREILPDAHSSLSFDELRARYARCDIAALDLDECMVPGFTQIILARRILFHTGLCPHRFCDLFHLPSLIRGGCLVTVLRGLDLVGFRMSRPKMMFVFERTLRGVSRDYFDGAAKGIPAYCRPMVEETVGLLSEKMPVGIISFCIDLIVREFLLHFNPGGDKVISFWDSNRLSFRCPDGRDILRGYDRARFMTTGDHKRRALDTRMREYSASHPFVVGHSDEDAGMAMLAQERNGIAVGFNPLPSCENAFNVIVHGRDWSPIHALCCSLVGKLARDSVTV